MKGKLTLIKGSGFDIFVRTFGILQLSQIVTPVCSRDVFFSPNLYSKKLATVIKMNLPRIGKLAIKCSFLFHMSSLTQSLADVFVQSAMHPGETSFTTLEEDRQRTMGFR